MAATSSRPSLHHCIIADSFSNLLLILAATGMTEVHIYRGGIGIHAALARVLLPLLCVLGLWLTRCLEVAFLCKREAGRREGALEALLVGQVRGCW